MSNSLRHYGVYTSRLPYTLVSPRVCLNSCPLSQWCHLTISSSVTLFSCPQSFPTLVFSNESALYIRCPKHWSFSTNLSNEYSGLISFRIGLFDLLAVQGTLKSFLLHHSLKVPILRHSAFFMSNSLTSIHDYWKNHSFDDRDLCQQSDFSAF